MEYHERSMYSPTNTLWLWDTKIQGSNLSILQNTKPCLLGGNGVSVLKVWGSKLNFIVFALASLTICHTPPSYSCCLRRDLMGRALTLQNRMNGNIRLRLQAILEDNGDFTIYGCDRGPKNDDGDRFEYIWEFTVNACLLYTYPSPRD